MTVQPTRDQLRALANAATEGPWEAMDYDDSPGDEGSCILTYEPGRGTRAIAYAIAYPWTTPESCEADAAFIAAARTALPQLLDQLEKAEADRDWNLHSSRIAKKERIEANARAERAEQRTRDLTQEVRDERGAARDQMEQVRIRDAQIKAVEDVHRHITVETRGATEPEHRCLDCCLAWPCPTIRALESVPPPGQ